LHSRADVELLTFELNDARYAIPLDLVREVARAVAVTPLPGAPPVVLGVIDVRGRIAPVYDLRRRLGLEPREIEPSDQFVLADSAGRLVALVVDRVEWMASVPDEAIHEEPEPGVPYISGLARLPDGLALIHDLAAFLSADESRALDRALTAEGSA
jgi:purine-binding chemotaxis protein CheW